MNTRIQVQAGRSRFQSLTVLLGLALLSFNIFAAPPNAPVFTELDGQELDPPNQSGRYSLDDAIRGLPFTVGTPTPPQIVAEQTVTPATVGNYINTPGIRLILQPGNYGDLSIGGTDKEIVFTTGVTAGRLYINGQRIVVRANPVRTGSITHMMIDNGAADVLLDGIYSNAGTYNEIRNVNRVAIISSHFRQVDYALSTFTGQHSNLILANSSFDTYGGYQSVVRLQSVQNLVFVDNLVRNSGGSSGGFRLHTSSSGQKSDNLYVNRNQMEGVGSSNMTNFLCASADGNPTTHGMGSVWWENTTVYHNGLWWIGTGPTALEGWPEMLVHRNNTAYIGSGGWLTASDRPWLDATFENNTVQAYIAPPAWEHQ